MARSFSLLARKCPRHNFLKLNLDCRRNLFQGTNRRLDETRQQVSSVLSSEASTIATPKRSWTENLSDVLRQSRTVPIPRWISPRHVTMTYTELFGHSSFVLVAISYAVDDFLMLRMIAVVGSTAMLLFTYFHPHGRVLWLPFKWNLLFIAINSYRIGRVHLDRYRAERLDPELIHLRDNNFYLLDPVDFARLVSIARIEEFRKGDVIIEQHCDNGYVRCVIDGDFRVLRDGKLTYMLESANFVSESGLHTGLLLPGAIESCCTIVANTSSARMLTWDRTELVELMERNPGLRRSFKATLSWDVIRKLKGQRTLVTDGLIDDADAWTERRTKQTKDRYVAILRRVLKEHPEYIQDRHNELSKYRMIHHIDDDYHAEALRTIGWSAEDFAQYRHKTERYDWKWYVGNFFYRIFG